MSRYRLLFFPAGDCLQRGAGGVAAVEGGRADAAGGGPPGLPARHDADGLPDRGGAAPFPNAVLVIVSIYFAGQTLIALGLLRHRAEAAAGRAAAG